MDLPTDIKQLLDNNLHLENLPKKSPYTSTKEYKWLPGYIVKFNDNRVENARILQDKINSLGLKNIKIPKKYIYNDYAICEKINGYNWFDGQKAMTAQLISELHILLTTGRFKYYDMICGNWVITENNILYIIDTDSKCIPKTLDDELFYEASWFLLGDIITGHGGCYMNRKVNYPWQVLIRSLYSKHCMFSQRVRDEIYRLFNNDKNDRLEKYNYYRNIVCKKLNVNLPNKLDPNELNYNNIEIQLMLGLYLTSLDNEYKYRLINDPHILKDILYKVHKQGYDECFSITKLEPITEYEIEDFQKWLTILLED